MGDTLKRRFYSKQELKGKDQVLSLDQDESHHIANVLRVETHERFRVFDEKGNDWFAQIERIDSHGNVAIRLVEQNAIKKSLAYQISVAQALPQRGKMDFIIEKAAELGVCRVIPMVTDRTIVKIETGQSEKVINRWQKIIREASKQSLSRIQTEVSVPQSFNSVLDQSNADEFIVLDPSGKTSFSQTVSDLRNKLARNCKLNILMLIGPEGGFTDQELMRAKEKKAMIVSLGDNILKTDTAFVAAVGALQAGLYE